MLLFLIAPAYCLFELQAAAYRIALARRSFVGS